MRFPVHVVLLALVLVAGPCSAQTPVASPPAAPFTFNLDALSRALDASDGGTGESARQDPPAWVAEGRACEGCPPRHLVRPFLEALGINVLYNLGNKARGEETADVSLASWLDNLKFGFEWDENPFPTNQIGHPYQGSNYFTAARANGLSFWESSSVAAFGSATWEYFGENNKASFNDLINTTLGGVALGEMFHRTAWLIRDTTRNGKGRLWQEIIGTAIDPLTGAHRFMSGDANRISSKPDEFIPVSLAASGSMGVLWQGDNTRAFQGTAKPYIEADLFYGDMYKGRSRTPYDAFFVDFRLGGGSAVSDARVRGRLLGQPLGDSGRYQLALSQAYDFTTNSAYSFGGQGFDLAVSAARSLSTSVGMSLVAGAGVVVLGAVDSIPRPAVTDPQETEGEGEPPREYDYGPGTTFGGRATFTHDGSRFADVSYRGYQIYVVDGIRANHVLQRLRIDLLLPIRGKLGIGVTGEYFYRKTYFQAGGEKRDHFPQFRSFLAWGWS